MEILALEFSRWVFERNRKLCNRRSFWHHSLRWDDKFSFQKVSIIMIIHIWYLNITIQINTPHFPFCAQLYSFKYSHISLIILFHNNDDLFLYSYSNERKSFAYRYMISSIIIQYWWFFKQTYSTHRWDHNRYNESESDRIRE